MIPAGCVQECPGCGDRELTDGESDERKSEWARKILAPWSERVRPLRAPTRRWQYRRKVTLHARRREGRWDFGLLRRRGREEIFVAIPDCPVHDPFVNEVARRLGAAALPEDLPLVFLCVSGRAVTLVLKAKRDEKILARMQSIEGLPSLWVNWNPAAGRRVLAFSAQERVRGPEWLTEAGTVAGLPEKSSGSPTRGIIHGPLSFRQQIPEMEDFALARAEAFLAEFGLRRVVDFYSGLGFSLCRWKVRGWGVAGVELGGEACRAAALNAPGAMVLRGRVEDRLPQIAEWVGEEDFLVYTNPPRLGQGAAVVEWLSRSRACGIAYLSCNLRSLREDLEGLDEGFEVSEIQPMDFFPQTPHVEALALLRRRVVRG
jgi:tRNA/tmRNA/rRNA uracil-C5-methylase (TrmA/RlmC/RlmD family)